MVLDTSDEKVREIILREQKETIGSGTFREKSVNESTKERRKGKMGMYDFLNYEADCFARFYQN